MSKNGNFLDSSAYQSLYQRSLDDPEGFWAEQARRLDWERDFAKVSEVSWQPDDLYIKWFEDGRLNACVNCIDRHLPTHADKTALIWEGDNPEQQLRISYRELHANVCRLANALEEIGIGTGDRIVLYMPMVVEAVYAMLASARIGAIHSVVFGGFSALSLAERIRDCGARLVITADCGVRGNKLIPLKEWVDEALDGLAQQGEATVERTLVLRNSLQKDGAALDYEAPTRDGDIDYHEITGRQGSAHSAQAFDAETPLFILYTSGSTGKPKGLVHTTGGYLCYAHTTFRYIFEHRPEDIFFCTADIGWITGHSYLVYGPLANAATTVVFGGVPTYPDVGRFGQIIDKHKISLFYTSPTAVRTLLAQKSRALASSQRSSLRVLGTVGEPINPDVWRWYHDDFGLGQCPIVDTWWQTETGGVLITPLPGAGPQKGGSAGKPFLGIAPAVVDGEHRAVASETSGELCISASWPGQARDIWGNRELFISTYYSRHPGMYFSGDGARIDGDGDYWVTGRIDDVLNVSGHRLGSAEVEHAAVAHSRVSEAAVVGCPHPIKGEAIYLFVVPAEGVEADDSESASLREHIRHQLGPIATPEWIQWTRMLPKTRSGKIMRRILRKVAVGEVDSIGDTSTLADPAAVEHLIDGRDALPEAQAGK